MGMLSKAVAIGVPQFSDMFFLREPIEMSSVNMFSSY